MKEITQEYLKQCLEYNSETGVFTWRHRSNVSRKWNTRYAGKIAGNVLPIGHRRISINKRSYRAHVLAFLYMTGSMPKHEIDHINGIPDDNRWCNLRDGEHALNLQNLRRPKSNNKTGFLGVTRSKKGFAAQITLNGIYQWIGTFKTPEEAHAAYLAKKRELHEFCTI